MPKSLIVKFSRHAKRRLKLYRIDDRDIIDEIQLWSKQHTVVSKSKFQISFLAKGKYSKLKLPIRIVATVIKTEVLIITAYPLKKGRKL